MDKLQISSISIDEKTGVAKLVFEFDGSFPVPSECDDPFIELFRPIRVKYSSIIFFTILVYHRNGSTICNLWPSNNSSQSLEELSEIATTTLKGDTKNAGIISEYKTILEEFFRDPEGLNLYLEKAEQIANSTGIAKTVLCNESNQNIKNFVAKNDFEMPSLKSQKSKKK